MNLFLKTSTFFLCLGLSHMLLAQTIPTQRHNIRLDSVLLIGQNGVADTLRLAWAGGLNNVQPSGIDLNQDGKMDLFLFDKTSDKVRTYLNAGSSGQTKYNYAPEYEKLFPKMTNFAQLLDYNCDGKMDVFTATRNNFGGLTIYRNDYSAANGLKFTLMTEVLLSAFAPNDVRPLSLSPQDISAFVDVDFDGDVDVVTFGTGSTRIDHHKNLSKELFNRCDSLVFRLETNCFGQFIENFANNTLTFNTCVGFQNPNADNSLVLHPGSTILLEDFDGDNDRDIVLGDLTYNNLVMATNGGNKDTARMVSQITNFPPNTTPCNLTIFPASYYLDINNDGKKDLIVSPNALNNTENKRSIWLYTNSGQNNNPTFTFQKNDFLQSQQLDLGLGCNPAFSDINQDGKIDLILGNIGIFDAANDRNIGQLTYLKNIGTATKPAFQIVDTNYLDMRNAQLTDLVPTFGDLDADGDHDLIIGIEDGTLLYYKNTALPNLPANYLLINNNFANIDIGNNAAPQLIDVNRDGKTDLLVGEKRGQIRYFQNIGTNTNAVFSDVPTILNFGNIDVSVACCGGFSRPFLVNINNQYQLFVSSEDGFVLQFINIDNNLMGNFTRIDTLKYNNKRSSVSGFDIDANGTLELAVGEAGGGMVFYKLGNPIGVVEQKIKPFEVKIYPNPSQNGEFSIDIKAFDGANHKPKSIELEIYTVLGQKTGQKIFTNHEFNTFNQTIRLENKGIYLLKIKFGNNVVVKTLLFD